MVVTAFLCPLRSFLLMHAPGGTHRPKMLSISVSFGTLRSCVPSQR